MVDALICDESDQRRREPLPEDDVLGHIMCFHFRLQLHIKDLQRFPGLERDHLRNRIHNRAVCRNWTTNRILRVRHVHDYHLTLVSNLVQHIVNLQSKTERIALKISWIWAWTYSKNWCVYLFSNTDKFFRLHGKIREANILCIDTNIGQVEIFLKLYRKILRHFRLPTL